MPEHPPLPRDSGLERTLQLELERHVLADEDAAGLQRGVPRETEVLAVDDGLRRSAGLVIAVGVAAETAEVEGERHGLGRAADGQIAVHEEVAALDAHTRGAALHRRVGLRSEQRR